MKHIAMCSGGKDSTAQLLLAKEHGEPLDEVFCVEVMFDKDTSGEVPEHIDFIHSKLKPFVETVLQVPFTIARSNKTFMDFFNHVVTRGDGKGKKHGFPIPGLCGVKRDCKLPPMHTYIQSQSVRVQEYVGIAADEPKRLASLKTSKISLLDKYGITEDYATDMCKDYGLYSPIYNFARRNGCWFCPNCGDSEWVHLIRHHPEMFDRLIAIESPNLYRRCLTVDETPSQLKKRLEVYTEQIDLFEYLKLE